MSMMEEVGVSAGIIWKALSEKGELPITKLRKVSDLGPTLFHLGLGWLAREGKVAFRYEENKTVVSLTDPGEESSSREDPS